MSIVTIKGMWRDCAIGILIRVLMVAPPSFSKIAGGMVYQTNEGIDQTPDGIMGYLAGHDPQASADILAKQKAYYVASADKTKARLELARATIREADIPESERKLIESRLNEGITWVENAKKQIDRSNDEVSFKKAINYKAWHAVKMLPTAAEGYAVTCAIETQIALIQTYGTVIPGEAESLNRQAKSAFIHLMSLTENSDFTAAEKLRLEAFDMAQKAHELVRHACEEETRGNNGG